MKVGEKFEDSVHDTVNSYVSLASFSRKSGETNDDGRFERLLEYACSKNIRNIIIPTDEYTITKEIKFTIDNLSINFSNSAINYVC